MGNCTVFKGLVNRQQVDASGHLETRVASDVLIDAFHVYHAISDAADAATDSSGQGTVPAPGLVSLRSLGAAPPRLGEMLRCVVQAPAAGDSPDALNFVLEGEHGAAWAGTVQADGSRVGTRRVRAAVPDLPAAVLMRRMHAGHCDQAGHVNVQVFLALVDDSVAVVCQERAPGRVPLQIVQARVSFKSELFCGDIVRVHSGVTGIDAHGVDMVHGIFHQPSGRLAGVVESRLAALDESGLPVAPGWEVAAGDALAGQAWPALPRARALAMPRAARSPGAGSLQTCQAVVDAWDADNAGWLQTRALVNLCSTGARQYLAQIGLDAARFLRDQSTVAAIDYAIDLHRRPRIGCNLGMQTTHLAASGKSIRFAHHLVDSQGGDVYATVEIVGVMLDLVAHRSTEVPSDIRERLEAMAPPAS
jgi:acyl-CoA thioesterase FadM